MTGTLAREPYPPAPWKLFGTSVQALRLADSRVARRRVPDDLNVVSVWPGKTLGVLYCASYELPSVLEYHELILAPALVATGGRIGFWISDIFVDHPASRSGGRGIWGLPKELAQFSWEPDRGEVSVRAGTQLLCRIRFRPGGLSWPMPLYLPVISRQSRRLGFFSGCGSASVGRATGDVLIPVDSPLRSSGFEDCRAIFVGRHLRLGVGAPRALA